MSYLEEFGFIDRLRDVLSWALVVDRLTDEEVALLEAAVSSDSFRRVWEQVRDRYLEGYEEGRLRGVSEGLAVRLDERESARKAVA